jgi:hypothetical protein
MKHVASFLLASGPTWRSPGPMESRLPHSHLYPSPRRFPVESHLLLGCSHKIPNGTSSAFGLSRCSTATSNTILGLCSQCLSRHVLPHAAPGFFAGRGRKGWWSSPNFASIHYVKTSNRSRSICNGPLTPVTCTHICNDCYLVPVTNKRGRSTPGLASATPVTNVDFW